MVRDRLHTVAKIVALAVVYLVAAKLGLMIGAVSRFATLVWPPTGIALAALLIFGNRLWPGVAAASFVVNVWTGAPVLVALGMSAGNTLEALLGAYAVRRFATFQLPLDRLRPVIGILLFAAMLSTAVSATVGVASLGLAGMIEPSHFAPTWRAWWLGDALGDLVVAPLLLVWAEWRRFQFRPWRMLEIAAVAASLVAMTWFVFSSRSGAPGPFRQVYLIFPVLIWAALRFGLRGATTAILAISAIAIWSTAWGYGPFVRISLSQGLLYLQSFMGTAAATALVLGAASTERAENIRRREEFLAVASHDLRGPLSNIQMSTSVMLSHIPEADPTRNQIEIVRRSVARMNFLIRDLLDRAAIDAGHLALKLQDHDARSLANEALALAEPQAQQKGQTVRALLPESPVVARCDGERILQVLANLIGNAIKFTPDGGVITLRVEPLARVVQFSITDTGPGMEKRELRHVYDRYWQAEPGAHIGTGLGLSIVKGIVESHGGKVRVESKTGAGSTFFFTLALTT